MIGHLSGKVIHKRDGQLILDVAGVGYAVHTPLSTLSKVELNEDLALWIHTIVREDQLSLYGFETNQALHLFEKLIGVNGVGPKMAIETLRWPIEKIKQAILSKDVTTLKQIPGVGKKTAERMILELRSKIGSLDDNHLPEEVQSEESDSIPNEVIDALLGLGYKQKHIHQVFRRLEKPMEDAESMIKYFIKHA